MKKKTYQMPYGVTVIVNEDGSGEFIGSFDDSASPLLEIKGVERLVLAHACAGIDIASPAYLEGLETVLDAISNFYY